MRHHKEYNDMQELDGRTMTASLFSINIIRMQVISQLGCVYIIFMKSLETGFEQFANS